MEIYQYRQLVGASVVRVLRLYPGSYGDPLSGALNLVNLDAAPPYTCLSYTWGEPDFTCQISIDGKRMSITTNLHDALQRLRSSNDNVDIWVDAICINQADLNERNSQVQMMGRIYRGCEECLVYLGEEYDHSERVPDFLQTLHNGYQFLFENERITEFQIIPPPSHKYWNVMPALDHPGWRALLLFMSRPWFRRVWIAQEFVLPRRVTIVCGKWRMDATFLESVLLYQEILSSDELLRVIEDESLNDFLAKTTNLIQDYAQLRLIHGNRSGSLDPAAAANRFGPPDLSLLNLLQTTTSYSCSDPRDRFFGVFGLATDLDDLHLKADYTKRLDESIIYVCQSLIKQGNGLELLVDAWHTDGGKDVAASWLPHWAVNDESCGFQCGDRYRLKVTDPIFNSHVPAVRIIVGSNMISLNGYLLDIVAELGAELLPSQRGNLAYRAISIKQDEDTIDNSTFLRAEHHQSDSYWRTLTGNLSRQRVSPVPAYIGEQYQLFSAASKTIEEDLKDMAKIGTAGKELDRDFKLYQDFFVNWAVNADGRLCITESGIMALVPRTAKVGDSIITVHGDPQYRTFTVRKEIGTDHYMWIGKAYVHCVFGDEYREIEEGEPVEILVS